MAGAARNEKATTASVTRLWRFILGSILQNSDWSFSAMVQEARRGMGYADWFATVPEKEQIKFDFVMRELIDPMFVHAWTHVRKWTVNTGGFEVFKRRRAMQINRA